MVALSPLAISVHTRNMGMVDEVCGSALHCVSSDLLSGLLLVVLTGLVMLVVAAIVHLSDARSRVEQEQSRTAAERDAFDRFARQVSDIEATGTQRAQAAGTITAVAVNPPDSGLRRVRDKYRDTVMAVPHYEEEYGESLAANMAAEFGEELATAVTQDAQLTPQLKQAFVRKGREARDRRERLMRTLDREADELEAAHEMLTDVEDELESMDERPLTERPFDDLAAVWKRLRRLDESCSRLIERRQERIHADADAGRRADGPDLHEYLYQSLPVTYPVLADATAVSDRIRAAQRRTIGALTRRV